MILDWGQAVDMLEGTDAIQRDLHKLCSGLCCDVHFRLWPGFSQQPVLLLFLIYGHIIE